MTDVPFTDQPTALRCAADPLVETYLRCGRCDTPICPRCLVMTPVGARCRACARLKKLPMFEVRPRDLLRGLAGGLTAATVGGALLTVVPNLGFFGLLLILGLGYAVGEATTGAVNRKRGTLLATVAALAVPVGIVLGRALMVLLLVGNARLDVGSLVAASLLGLIAPLWNVLLVGVAMAIAFSRVR